VSEAGWDTGALSAEHDARGFTSADLRLLHEAHQNGLAARRWGRCQFAANEFSQYLAIWSAAAPEHAPPGLTIIRFSETGAYALMAGGRIVANGKTLAEILPALTRAERAQTEAA
jgi:hypothetical protein